MAATKFKPASLTESLAIAKGTVKKDGQGYLKRVKEVAARSPKHPTHHGIKMQVHHVISAEGAKRSGVGEKLELFGYNINYLPNLVSIPSTLQGACHLKVQPHRGNHTAQSESDSDDDHPSTYHEIIKSALRDIEPYIPHLCFATHSKQRRDALREMVDKISYSLMKQIQNRPRALPLTDVAKYFNQGEVVGCAGLTGVSELRNAIKNNPDCSCPSSRSHVGEVAKEQATGTTITYANPVVRYDLKQGY